MDRDSRKLLTLLITAGSLFLATVIVLIVFGAINLPEQYGFVEAIFIVLSLFLAALSAISLFNFLSHRTLMKTLEIENEAIIGKKSTFNNAYIFQKKAVSAFKYRSHQKQHIIAFSFSNLIVSQNVNRNVEIFNLNSHIVDYLEGDFIKAMNARPGDFVFGYSRGNFLIYTFKQNEQSIQKIADLIAKELYSFASEGCPHVWVQPFFGVVVVNPEELIASQIENATLARDYSERNFESITYYQSSFRRTVSSNDIDELQDALINNEFVVYFQPKFDLNKKEFISSEALIRWKSEKYGLLSPTKFLGKAEAAGLTHEIDTFVLRKVCESLNDFRRRGKRLLPVSVNFSLYEFYSANFLDTILEILKEYNIPTNLIEIEITEATSQANSFLSVSIIKKLKDQGIRVLMDDFGVGFSNVGNLRKIPFDAIKIDKSFIDNIVTDMKSREIVRFLINLAKTNEMEVIAEGVDNKEQLAVLKNCHCDTIQGFYYSQALSKQDYEKFLISNPFERKEEEE